MKKKFLVFVLSIISILIITQSCKLATSPDEDNDIGTKDGIFKISGVVVDSVSGDPLESAIVKLVGTDTTYVIRTDTEGNYSTEISINKALDFYVTASKEGYYARTVQITATADDIKKMPPFQLRPFLNLPAKSVDPASINLFSQSRESIGVKESGAVEAAEVVFEVRDSSGIPLDLDHKSTVYFRLGNSPGGGEFLFPASTTTNGKGQASVAVNSGTKAGVVQVVAEINHKGNIIRSKPVFIAVHGGLPNDAHLTLTLPKYNIPALLLVQDFNATIIAGDKYSNPVVQGTVFHFSTTGGTIEGSILTDNLGKGVANFNTGNPIPTHPVHGIAYGVITAKTANENEDSISVESLFLYSGGIEKFSVVPTSFNLDDGGSQNFNYVVSDRYDHPLTSGSSYRVTVEGKNMGVSGQTEVSMGDVLFGNTQFSFTVYDELPDSVVTTQVKITITATHPLQGSTKIEVLGSGK